MNGKDKGVTPGAVNRAWNSYEKRSVNAMSDQVMADARGKAREEASSKREKELKALAVMQASRPMRPPGRR